MTANPSVTIRRAGLADAAAIAAIYNEADRILLGIDQLRILRRLNGAGTQSPPRELTLAGQPVKDIEYSASERLLRIRFQHQARPRELIVQFEPAEVQFSRKTGVAGRRLGAASEG